MKQIMFVSTSVKFLTVLILFGVCIDALSWKKRLRLRPFVFLLTFWDTGEQQHIKQHNFVFLQIFQPMKAKIGYVDCQAVLLLVERYEEGQNV